MLTDINESVNKRGRWVIFLIEFHLIHIEGMKEIEIAIR